MPENHEIDDDSELMPASGDEELLSDIEIAYEANTERIRAYTAFLRNTVPRIGVTSTFDGGRELEIDSDVASARNLAVMAVYADIRRIAGDGRPNFDAENCS